ncbi:hypothetical protein CDES_02995 [Corynebacterium deserti GIMN1.010]|uniref:Type VII secretion-associated protein n=1 Tax=Corynebacterium deserti GIMN1.010 TaxID=931089 RepID=A0A0M4CEM0_9CORY|nr:type VII secretion-associated protein [Corynebacterium deserti]ALC05052.1 hypothetical protein CDES_02995 [Corynebacterium deserti GIMN1.010]
MITVTVVETVTIFSADDDTTYRYDVTASAIIEGWAIPAVVDQVKTIAGDSWPDIQVIIDANDEVTDKLTSTLVALGANAEAVDELVAVDDPVPQDTVVRPTQEKKPRRFYGITPVHLLLVSVLVGAIAASWLALGFMKPEVAAAPPEIVEEVSGVASISSIQPQPPAAVLVTDDLLIEAPFGFELVHNEGATYLAGADPNLRIHVSADPLHGADVELVAEELRRLIADDPTLAEQPAVEWNHDSTIDYAEAPGDGSHVLWVSWFEADRHISVGCHSRGEATLVHKAQCRQVVENLVLK